MATNTRRATPEGGCTLEYDELVNFYKQKLQERYRKCTENPDKRQLMELIQRADEEKISRIAALLEEKGVMDGHHSKLK